MKAFALSGTFALFALLAAAPASGQQASRPERPYRGLFAGGDRIPEQQLVLNVSLGGGYDDNILADALQNTSPTGPGPTGRSGKLGNAGVGLSYTLNADRVNLEVSARSGVRYYPALESSDPYVSSEHGQVISEFRLTDSTTLLANALVTRRPQNLDGVLSPQGYLGAGPDTYDLDLPTTFDHYRRYAGTATLSQKFSSKVTFQANYGQRITEAPEGSPFSGRWAGAGLSVMVARGLALRAGYEYGQGRFVQSSGRRVEHQNIDGGIAYSRALSFSRNTTLSFSTGSSAVQLEGRRRYRASGAANLTHEIGRTWTASLGYVRGARFTETWDEPLFSDVATASLSGLLSRRLQVASGVGGAMRQLAFSRDRGFTSYWATTNVSYALTRNVNFGIDYLYTRHRFDADVLLPTAWQQRGERQRVTAHVGVWVPLFTRARRPNATR